MTPKETIHAHLKQKGWKETPIYGTTENMLTKSTKTYTIWIQLTDHDIIIQTNKQHQKQQIKFINYADPTLLDELRQINAQITTDQVKHKKKP